MDQAKRILVFKALSDQIRIEIIKYLKENPAEITCGEIGKIMGISKTSGSYHFKILEAAGLITTRKAAREKYIKLNQKTIEAYITNFYSSL
ncbi:ArsR/SmtB family transcription factor [Fructilactobacillus frigidiflavus]|uniref:ArsR/SmtB family transcription factor n=1 Tax=Fructilactobacillus frigidiflavus TaxID=3242688 RepID=UPI003756D976